MPRKCKDLEHQILAAFKRALAEERLDVAEHLLKALEAFQPEPEPATSVAQAYQALVDSSRRQRPLQQADSVNTTRASVRRRFRSC